MRLFVLTNETSPLNLAWEISVVIRTEQGVIIGKKKKKEKYSLIDIKCCIAVTSIYIVYVHVLLSL